MKYISFIVPCYNSQEYMRRCIDSLLLDERRVEIILVDDGSTDLTGTIADEYVVAHPQCIRVIHQKNRGHGGGGGERRSGIGRRRLCESSGFG